MFCYISCSKDEQFSSKFYKESFLLYKLYNYFPPSDIPSNNESNKFKLKYIIATVSSPCSGVVLQFQVSQSTGQDLVALQVHPADLPRRFQQPLKLDNYDQA